MQNLQVQYLLFSMKSEPSLTVFVSTCSDGDVCLLEKSNMDTLLHPIDSDAIECRKFGELSIVFSAMLQSKACNEARGLMVALIGEQ